MIYGVVGQNMVDPTGMAVTSVGRAVGTAAGRALTSRRGGTRLGGREERRAVYGHFLTCAFEYREAFTRINTLRGALRPKNRAAYTDSRLRLRRAYAELLLVGNLGPASAGYELASVLLSIRDDYFAQRTAYVESGMPDRIDGLERRFIEICRHDLLYAPRRWQVWRPQWWAVVLYRRREMRRLRGEASEGQKAAPDAHAALPAPA